MTGHTAIRGYRAVLALLTVAAIVTQMASLIGKGTFDTLNYFSYFTIDSNLIATAVFAIGALGLRPGGDLAWDLIRGAAVVYMTVVGVVFTLLLKGTDVDTTIAWVNTVVHELMPIAVVADWLIDPPRSRLDVRRAVAWLAFPLVWIVYTMVKGPIVGKYPYPFLNPANGGYGSVALYSLAILVFMLLLAVAVVWAGNRRGAE